MFVIGRADNVVGEEARQIIRDAVDLFGHTTVTLLALETGLIFDGSSIDSEDLLFDQYHNRFHKVTADRMTVNSWFFDIARCRHCNAWHFREIYVDGKFYCSTECAEEAGLERCNHCDSFVNPNEFIRIDDYVFCDDDCVNSYGFHWCNSSIGSGMEPCRYSQRTDGNSKYDFPYSPFGNHC